VKVFISYAHTDLEMVERLLAHLRPLETSGQVSGVWIDRSLRAGECWSDAIAQAIRGSDVFILCLTPNYVASQYLYEVELPAMRQRLAAGGLILPVVLTPCAWYLVSEEFQAAPDRRGRVVPVSEWGHGNEGYEAAVRQISDAIDVHFNGKPAAKPERTEKTTVRLPELSYAGTGRLSDEAIDRMVNVAFPSRTPGNDG
jgi:hypothetical protein